MAILSSKEVKEMNKADRVSKLKDLRLELVKANVTANKTNAKTKEIKRAISRLITSEKLNNNPKGEELKKK
jgi:ribosomal protein L17